MTTEPEKMTGDRNTLEANPQSERLVAYLDGELSTEQSEAIEKQLATDAELREELGQFDRVWNLLDYAPRPAATPVFAESTVAMIAVEAERDVTMQTVALPAVRRRRGWITTLMTLSAATLAFVVVRGVASRADRQLLLDLPVIQQAAVLSQVDSLEFLRQVRDKIPRLVASTEGLGLAKEVETWEWLVEATPAMRADWIAELSPDEREELAGKATAFRALSPHNIRRLHDLDHELASAEDHAELRLTALAYHSLLSTQSAGEQAAILALPPEERIAELRRKRRPWSEEALIQLSDGEKAHFREVALALAATPSVKNVAERGSRRGGPGRQVGERLRKHPEAVLFFTASVMAREGRWANHFAGSPQAEKLKELWPAWEAELIKGMPERLQSPINQLPAPRRAKLLRTQLIESAAPARPGDAMQFFAELSGEEQQKLLAMPATQMQQQLREQMSDERMGLGQLEKMWRGGQDRRGGPPHRGPGSQGHRSPGDGPPFGPHPGRRPPH